MITLSLAGFAFPLPLGLEEASALVKRSNRNDGSRSYQIGTGNAPGVPVGQNCFITIDGQVWDTRHNATVEGAELTEADQEEYKDVAEDFHGQDDQQDENDGDDDAEKVLRGQVRRFRRPIKPQGLKFSSTGRRI